MFCSLCLCSKRSYPALAHPSLAALNWKSGNQITVYQLPVQLRMLCCWPMKCPVPLDKGNEGSGNEIGFAAPGGSRNQFWYARVRIAYRPFWCCVMRTLYKFCVFVPDRRCLYFESKFRSLAVLSFFALSYQFVINHRMQATLKLSLLNSASFENSVRMSFKCLFFNIKLTIFSCSCSFSSLQQVLESR